MGEDELAKVDGEAAHRYVCKGVVSIKIDSRVLCQK